MKARIIINLPKNCRVWKVLALPDRDGLPVDCQIIGPIAFEALKPRKKKTRVRNRSDQ